MVVMKYGEKNSLEDKLRDEAIPISNTSLYKSNRYRDNDPSAENDIRRALAIIPCYNEEATIGSVVLKTRKYVDEVLVIDDGSADGTAEIARQAGATVLSHKANLGKSAGMKTGFSYALDNGFDHIITLDGDGQHNADEIPNLLGIILNGGNDIDISIGMRSGKDTEMPTWRRVGKRVLDYSTSFGSGGYLTDSQFGFRAFNKKAIAGITPRLRGNAFSTESEQLVLAHELGLNVTGSHVSCKYSSIGNSTTTSTETPTSHGIGVLSYVIWLIAERRPLLFIGVPGLLCVVVGIFLAILTMQAYNITHVFSIPYALLTSFFLMVGALAVFIGLLFHTIPHVIKRTMEEKEMEDYARNNRP